MLSDEALADYLATCTQEQSGSITEVRSLILDHCPDLVEVVDEGKWFGGLLTYSTNERMFLYALGPRSGGFTTFHMMPYYGSPALKERHEGVLKGFLTGKSCIKFKRFSDVPEASIRDILSSTPSLP